MSNDSGKKSKKKLIIIGAIVAAALIGIAGTGGKEDTSKDTATKTSTNETQEKEKDLPTVKPLEKKEKTQEFAVDAATIIADYEANELAADDKYKGKFIEISGTFDTVSDSLSFKTMRVSNGSEIMDTNFSAVTISIPLKSEANINLAKGLVKGDSVTVIGTVKGYSFYSIDLKDDAVIFQ